MLELSISGELYNELNEGTALDDGTAPESTWGYGATREVDVEVRTMVKTGATMTNRGFGRSVKMTGSTEAWAAIAAYARDRGEMETQLIGDFDRGMGTRLLRQADRIEAKLS
jgi:hypothetical protein